MTPSEKLDAILNAGRTPTIGDVVDVDKYKYVWRVHGGIRCGDWLIAAPYGLLSDGATGVPDRCPEAFFGHDKLVLSPYAYYKNVRKKLSRKQCGKMYARIGLRRGLVAVWLEGMALAYLGLDKPVWNKYRAREAAGEDLIATHTVPHAACWSFPTQYTRDAIWTGA